MARKKTDAPRMDNRASDPARAAAKLPGRSSFGVARAQDAAFQRLRDVLADPAAVRRSDGPVKTARRPAVAFDDAEKAKRAAMRSGRADLRAAAPAALARPERQAARIEKLEKATCKDTPRAARSGGSGRSYVPWCSAGGKR